MKKEMSLIATVEKTPDVLGVAEDMLIAVDCPVPVITQILLSIEEIYVNVASYAYGEEEGECKIIYNVEKNRIEVDISDGGIPFDPLAKEDPDITLKAMDRPIGGLGILMTKKMMDEVNYRYENNENHLFLAKNW